jgi:NADH-quinone oxidoreductase subunit B
MEVERRTIDPQQLRLLRRTSPQMLRGADTHGFLPGAEHDDLRDEDLERHVAERIMTTTLERAVAWARSNSFFPATFGLACCAIEMMSIVASRVDVARFGFEAFRASPRQADLLILSGRVSIKMAPIVRRIYDQMLEPKWAISMGACCSSMGVFNNYAIVPADKFMPIDVHVPGCPPRPEALMHGVLKLRRMVQDDPDAGWRERYGAVGTEEVVAGAAGPAQAPLSATAVEHEQALESDAVWPAQEGLPPENDGA